MTKPISMLDTRAENAPFESELRQAFERVLHSGRFILGPEVERFEQEAAAHLGVAHAIGVSSGTDALLLALMALDIGPGDEVITTPFTFFATAGSIARLGAVPVFVDIDPLSFNLDAKAVEHAITSATKAIMPVHLFGQPADMAALTACATAHHIPIIEDAAQAFGARTDIHSDTQTHAVGALGAFGCFSFFPSKNLGGFGDGGLVTTQDLDLANKARILRAHGSSPKYYHAFIGGNFRLDALQAALLRVKLPHLNSLVSVRKRNAEQYTRMFEASGLTETQLRAPQKTQQIQKVPKIENSHVYNQYVIRTNQRDALKAHLDAQQIANAIYYPLALHQQACFAHLPTAKNSLSHTEKACDEVLALPIAGLTQDQVQHVADTIICFLKSPPHTNS